MARRKRTGLPAPPTRPRIPFALLFRMFVIGGVAVIGSAYALWRHTHTTRPPILVPVPAATEIPAPELLPLER